MNDANDYIYWDVGREIVSLGPLTLRWYGILFALGFIVGFFIVRWMFRIERKPEADLDRLLLYLLVGTIVGARLGHCLFYDPAYYLSNPLEIIKVWKGGLASHGGGIGVFLALYLYSRKHKDQPYLWVLDRVAVPTALAGSFIRLGNLFNSEILGVQTDVPWAFIFARVDRVPRHPAQLYESLSYLLIFLLLLWLYNRFREKTPPGLLIGVFLVSVFTARIAIEFVKVRQAAFGEALPLSMGQLLSIPMILAGAWLVWRAWKTEATRKAEMTRA
jgi:prolipoprotein diacylglyceryl transferase